VGGGVQLGPLGTAATNRPIVPALGDYDDGEIAGMIGRGNRSTRRKPAPVPQPQTPHAARTWTRAAAVGSQRLTEASHNSGAWGNGSKTPRILNVVSILRSATSFELWSSYLEEIAPSTHWTFGYVGSSADLALVERRKILPPLWIHLWSSS
jgi:hypothetical protein